MRRPSCAALERGVKLTAARFVRLTIAHAHIERYEAQLARPIRLRTAALVQYWIAKYWQDFHGDEPLVQSLILFIERTFSEPDMKGTGAALRAWIERKQKLVRAKAR